MASSDSGYGDPQRTGDESGMRTACPHASGDGSRASESNSAEPAEISREPARAGQRDLLSGNKRRRECSESAEFEDAWRRGRAMAMQDPREVAKSIVASTARRRHAANKASVIEHGFADKTPGLTKGRTPTDHTPAKPESEAEAGPALQTLVDSKQADTQSTAQERNGDERWRCLYVTAAPGGSSTRSTPSRELLPEDGAVLKYWHQSQRLWSQKMHSSDSAAGPQWTERLMDFCIALYIGHKSLSATMRRNNILAPEYYSMFIAPLRDENIASGGKSERSSISAHDSHEEFQGSSAVVMGMGGRCLAEHECVFLPVLVGDSHWILIVVTNIDVLYAILNQQKMTKNHSRKPRIFVADPVLPKKSAKVLKERRLALDCVTTNVHHWLASMFLLDHGAVQKPGSDGKMEWSVSPSKLHKMWQNSRASVPIFENILEMVKRNAKVIPVPCPKVGDSLGLSGPFCALSLYTFVVLVGQLKLFTTEWEARLKLSLSKAFSENDAAILCGKLLAVAGSLIDSPIEDVVDVAQNVADFEPALTRMETLFAPPLVKKTSFVGAPANSPEYSRNGVASGGSTKRPPLSLRCRLRWDVVPTVADVEDDS